MNRPLIITDDQELLDDLLRVAAAAGVEVDVAHAAAHARPYWTPAPLVVVGVLSSAVTAFFYVRIIVLMFFAEPAENAPRVLRPGGYFLLIDGTVRDDEPEAEAWIHQVEKLRDPSHARFLTPRTWRSLCEEAGLQILRCDLFPFKQPNLEWYFQTAATPPENQEAVRRLLAEAPEAARRVFRIQQEGDTIVWWWDRLALVAQKDA